MVKSEVLTLRLSPEEKSRLQARAESYGCSMSELIVNRVVTGTAGERLARILAGTEGAPDGGLVSYVIGRGQRHLEEALGGDDWTAGDEEGAWAWHLEQVLAAERGFAPGEQIVERALALIGEKLPAAVREAIRADVAALEQMWESGKD